MAKKYYVDEHAAGLIEWAVKMLRSLKGGPGVRVLRDNTGMTISLTPVKEYRPQQSGGGQQGAFAVYLTQVGGSNGDDGSTTTAAFPTYTYDVYTDAAKTIKVGSALSVEWHRDLKIAVTAATHGMAQWDGATLRLLSTDESRDRDACP